MAIQMIGAAAPFIASSVGSVVVSAVVALLATKIVHWAYNYFNYENNVEDGSLLDKLLVFGSLALIYCTGPVISYPLTSFLARNQSYATIAKITNVILSFVGSIEGVILHEQFPDIPVNKAEAN